MSAPLTPHGAVLEAIYRYPVKGLSPEPMTEARLTPGGTLPADRLYAIENGPSGFDAEAPRHLAKSHFLMLMRNERLAALTTRFDAATHVLAIERDGRDEVRAALRTADGRAAVEAFFAVYCADELRGTPRVLAAEGHSFSDVARKVASLINLASVAEIARLVGRPVDPLRFRGNLYVRGWPAWHEFSLLGRSLAIGGARLTPVKRIRRCAATNVDPASAARDLDIPAALMQALGHADCGIYAEVTDGGTIHPGDVIQVL